MFFDRVHPWNSTWFNLKILQKFHGNTSTNKPSIWRVPAVHVQRVSNFYSKSMAWFHPGIGKLIGCPWKLVTSYTYSKLVLTYLKDLQPSYIGFFHVIFHLLTTNRTSLFLWLLECLLYNWGERPVPDISTWLLFFPGGESSASHKWYFWSTPRAQGCWLVTNEGVGTRDSRSEKKIIILVVTGILLIIFNTLEVLLITLKKKQKKTWRAQWNKTWLSKGTHRRIYYPDI